MHAHLLPFIGVVWLILVTPGVDMALVTRNALRGGRAAAVATAFGVNTGVAVWALAAACGLAAAIQASATLFDIVRLGGAAYLIALGIRSLIGSASAEDPDLPPARSGPFRQGVMSNLLNPKMAVLFTSLLPQFVDPRAAALPQFLFLGVVFNVLGVIWLVSFALVVARSRSVLSRPRVRRIQERITGTVLVALGTRVALDRR
jgi:threonine/homoserine/homoserine lactone efflux protein